MSIRSLTFSHRPRTTRLAASLAVALGVILSAGSAERAFAETSRGQDRLLDLPSYLHGKAAAANAAHRQTPVPHAPTPRAVTTCDDDINNPNSLRAQVAAAMSGDTIDLSPLLMVCSTITLGSEIAVPQDNLSFTGPGSAYLTVDGDAHSRIFKHTGAGTLAIYDLTIANGYYTSGNSSNGGCIYSTANVFLNDSVVSHCRLESTGSGMALGAGISTLGKLSLFHSTISDNDAHATLLAAASAVGGGAYARGGFEAKYSTISNNTAYEDSGVASNAGGVFAFGNATILGSTISQNRAEYTGGIAFAGQSYTISITNSTISGNTGRNAYGGIRTSSSLTLSNSTVAFNRSNSNSGSGLFSGTPVTLSLFSSIIADNIGDTGASDLGGVAGTVVNGDRNLILASSLPVPGINMQTCPQLEPLADNGGYTRTHALHHTSPAIDEGSNLLNLSQDQRLAPRSALATPDVGAVEWQPGEIDERIFANRFDGPLVCDE